ncbi:Pmp3 family protein [Acinetobacter johnsonii]|uniref:Pmp3 family protein n=1 Tax=Acinetobacter johnsonii TaxID=40214 RepID=UPI0011E80D1F|nr:Pmp3 family protein [Acinetobacter johnsonii]QEK36125.1 Pmp3 family protein [Acinetobacter johnsonii]
MANKCISCNNCGHVGWSKNRGNFLITLVLAFFFLLPAIVYEIWRRTGVGVCDNCGSDLVTPSRACTTSKPSDLGDLIALGILGIIGGIVVVALYALTNAAINAYKNKDVPPPQLTQKDYEASCMLHGIKYYQSINQHPITSSGELVLDKVQAACKGSKDGNYKAP